MERICERLHNIVEFILDIPYEALDFLMAHKWAARIVTIVVSILASLITMILLSVLMAAGYIPRPML